LSNSGGRISSKTPEESIRTVSAEFKVMFLTAAVGTTVKLPVPVFIATAVAPLILPIVIV